MGRMRTPGTTAENSPRDRPLCLRQLAAESNLLRLIVREGGCPTGLHHRLGRPWNNSRYAAVGCQRWHQKYCVRCFPGEIPPRVRFTPVAGATRRSPSRCGSSAVQEPSTSSYHLSFNRTWTRIQRTAISRTVEYAIKLLTRQIL